MNFYCFTSLAAQIMQQIWLLNWLKIKWLID